MLDMKNFCLTKDDTQRIVTHMKAIGFQKLSEMNFGELETVFTQATGSEQIAVELAKGFKLAVLSKRKNALKNWMKSNLTPEERAKEEKRNSEDTAREAIKKEYQERIKEIRQKYKEKKITNTERVNMEKIAKEVKEKKEREPLTTAQKAERNIKRLQSRLEDIKAGKVPTRERRTLTAEEVSLHRQIDEEMAKLFPPVYENMEQDIIERAVGFTISTEEVSEINRLVQEMNEAEKLPPDNPYNGFHSSFFDARNKLNTYLDTVNPMSKMDILQKVIFRGTLLAAPKSLTTNLVGNTTMGITATTVNAIQQRKFSGLNSQHIMPFAKNAWETYRQTKIDTVRVMDTSTSGSTVLGEHFQGVGSGESAIHKYGRFVEQYVFTLTQGGPDVYFAALHFANHANILSTKIAARKGLTGEALKNEAERLMLNSMSLRLDEKSDPVAYEIKRASVDYAMNATYQNNSRLSEILLDIRNAIDDYTGIFRVGTNVSPFVKTIVNLSIVSARLTGVSLTYDAPRLIVAIQNGDTKTMNDAINGIIYAGLGLLLVQLIASGLDDDDYIPDYILATDYQRDMAKLNNAPYNSVRVGDKWVSLGYTPFGWSLAATLQARQEKGVVDKSFGYVGALLLQSRSLPVLNNILGVYDYLNESKEYNKDSNEKMADAVAWTGDFFSSRTIPAFISDLAKALDDKERFTQYGYEGIVDRFKARIPFVREDLPEKHNLLGEIIYTENAFWVMMAGARVKSAPTDSELIRELSRLSQSGEEVKLKYNTNKDIKTAKKLLSGAEYNEFERVLQTSLTNTYANTMATSKYKKETDPEKQKAMLMKKRDGVLKEVVKQLGYTQRFKDAQKAE